MGFEVNQGLDSCFIVSIVLKFLNAILLNKNVMFKFIDDESYILGFNVARSDERSLLQPLQLVEELEVSEIDILKLSCKNPLPDLFSKLDRLNLKYYVLGITQEYKSFFTRILSPKKYLHSDIEFIEFTLDKKQELMSLVKAIFKNNAASYFNNPALVNFIDDEKQLECLAVYIATFSKELDENKYTHLMYLHGNPVGFVTSYREGTGGGVLYAGILEEYVGRGYYIDLVRFIQNYGKAIGQKWGLAYAQIHHTTVQKTFIKEGLIPQGYVLNIHVNCGFGKLKHLI